MIMFFHIMVSYVMSLLYMKVVTNQTSHQPIIYVSYLCFWGGKHEMVIKANLKHIHSFVQLLCYFISFSNPESSKDGESRGIGSI